MAPEISDYVRKAFATHAIRTQITCPLLGHVLDIRTAKYALDGDGLPAVAFSPEGFAALEEHVAQGNEPLSDVARAKGYVLEGYYRDANGEHAQIPTPDEAAAVADHLNIEGA